MLLLSALFVLAVCSLTTPCLIIDGSLDLNIMYEFSPLQLRRPEVYKMDPRTISLHHLFTHNYPDGLTRQEADLLLELSLLVAVFQGCSHPMKWFIVSLERMIKLDPMIFELKSDLAIFQSMKVLNLVACERLIDEAKLLWMEAHDLPRSPRLQQYLEFESTFSQVRAYHITPTRIAHSISNGTTESSSSSQLVRERSLPSKKKMKKAHKSVEQNAEEELRQKENLKRIAHLNWKEIPSIPDTSYSKVGAKSKVKCLLYGNRLYLSQLYQFNGDSVKVPDIACGSEPQCIALSYLTLKRVQNATNLLLSPSQHALLLEWSLLMVVFNSAFPADSVPGITVYRIAKLAKPLADIVRKSENPASLVEMMEAFEEMKLECKPMIEYLIEWAIELWPTDPGLPNSVPLDSYLLSRQSLQDPEFDPLADADLNACNSDLPISDFIFDSPNQDPWQVVSSNMTIIFQEEAPNLRKQDQNPVEVVVKKERRRANDQPYQVFEFVLEDSRKRKKVVSSQIHNHPGFKLLNNQPVGHSSLPYNCFNK